MGEKEKKAIGKNIKYLRKQKGLTQQELADELEIQRSSIGAYEESRADPKYETLVRMSNFFSISIDMLIKEDLTQFSPEELRNQQDQHKLDLEGKKLRVLSIAVDKDDTDRQYIDFVNTDKVAASYLKGFSDPEFIRELPKFQLPIPSLRAGTYRAFEIEGDSMLPLQSGTIIIGEYVEDWRGIKDGQTYVIVSEKEGLVYKRVFSQVEKDGGYLNLVSDNAAYSPFKVDIEDVREIWKAKMYVSSEFPDPTLSLEKLASIVMDVQREVIRMKAVN